MSDIRWGLTDKAFTITLTGDKQCTVELNYFWMIEALRGRGFSVRLDR